MELMRFENNKNQNNCYINSILHIYLRIPEIKSALTKLITMTPSNADYNGQPESYHELLKVITSAYSDDDEIVSMDKFRQALGSDYPHTFVKNQAGDAQIF
mmetsp:Transcript_21377/g.23799  ORF Transcript_21377/g.23799 Transcript_21377/m.23799 type:complete len:101 (-) Transcript_21377:1185-1487(-)